MNRIAVVLSNAPEVARLIRTAAPDYRKRTATLVASESVTLSGTFWDGGTRYTYIAVNLATGQRAHAPQFNPPQFGGPSAAPVVAIPEGVAVIQTGTFCGKTSQACVYMPRANLARLLPEAQP